MNISREYAVWLGRAPVINLDLVEEVESSRTPGSIGLTRQLDVPRAGMCS
jgi:hypothetical protein